MYLKKLTDNRAADYSVVVSPFISPSGGSEEESESEE
jgi:hypothetical protein